MNQSSKHKRLARFFCCLLAVATVLTATGCSGSGNQPAAAQAERDILVEAARPATGNMELTTDFVGTVEPAELVSVFTKVPGTVERTYYEVGDQVHKGDLLFEIDSTDVQLQVNVAEAALNSAQASVDQALGSSMDSQLLQAESGLKQAENAFKTADDALEDYEDSTSSARRKLRTAIDGYKVALKDAETKTAEGGKLKVDYDNALDEYGKAKTEATTNPSDAAAERLENATKALLAIEREYQDTKDSIPTLTASIASAQAQIDAMDDKEDSTLKSLKANAKNAGIAKETAEQSYELLNDKVKTDASMTAQAQLAQARASYDAAAKQLEYTKVYSPIDGIIEQKAVTEQGMAVQSNPAYVVSNKSQMQVTFYVSADAVREMVAGDAVTIESGSRTYNGTISEIGVMVDPSSGLFKVKANVDGDSSGLLTGLTVKVKAVTAKAANSLLIPQSCVYYEDGLPYVYTYQGGTAHKTPVVTGISNTDEVEILSGLTTEMQLITSWHPNLVDGAKVTLSGSDAQQVNAPAADGEEGSEPSADGITESSVEGSSSPDTEE